MIEDVVAILSYVALGPVAVSDEIVHDALCRLQPSRAEEIMASFGQAYGQAYFERGLAEGEARGEANALMRLLEKRFGPLPSRLRERIVGADAASIEDWFDRAISAPDLQSVFEAEGRG